jgi:hypothetical protein
MPSQNGRKEGKQGRGHYEKLNGLPAPGWKNMLYKATSR